jgi:hypothetical protein
MANPQLESIPLLPGYAGSAREELDRKLKLFFNASFLYWQAQESGLELGVEMDTPPTSPHLSSPIQSERKNFDFKYQPGFKLCFGIDLDYDDWILFSEYTWYHTGRITHHLNLSSDKVIDIEQEFAVTARHINLFNKGSKTWDLKMDFADLLIGRHYYLGRFLTLLPSFGARGAWIRQKLKAHYVGNGIVTFSSVYTNDNTNDFFNKSVSSGFGPRMGVDIQWKVSPCWQLLGSAATDILYTQYDLLTLQHNYTTATGSANNWFRLEDEDLQSLRPHIELMFGLSYSASFAKNQWRINLAAQYGFQTFFDQNMFLQFNLTPPTNNNLYLHGLNFTMRWDF